MPLSRFTINNDSRSPGIGEAIIFPPRSASGCTLHILEVSVSNADNRYGAVIGADQCQVAAPSAVYIYSVYSHPLPICSRIWYSSAGHNGNIQISWYTLPRQTHTLEIIITAAVSPNNLGCEIFKLNSKMLILISKHRKITQPIFNISNLQCNVHFHKVSTYDKWRRKLLELSTNSQIDHA